MQNSTPLCTLGLQVIPRPSTTETDPNYDHLTLTIEDRPSRRLTEQPLINVRPNNGPR